MTRSGRTGIRETLVDYRMLFSEVIAVDRAVAWAAFQLGCRTSKRLPLVDALFSVTS
jgi:hypothetical protein